MLSTYPEAVQPGKIEPLGSAGGFSGAEFWRLTSPTGLLCLRHWPREHPDAQQLEFIHTVLRHVDRVGFHLVPVPVPRRDGSTFGAFHGRLYELTNWLPGDAEFHQNPTPTRLSAAMKALAQFHNSANSCERYQLRESRSRGIESRLSQTRQLLSKELREIERYVNSGDWPSLEPIARKLIQLVQRHAPSTQFALEQVSQVVVPLQPCIRDIWHDHILFEGDRVTGLVDFGAMRMEAVSGDIARLLGSLIGDDADRWHEGIGSYNETRPLSDVERNLIVAFNQSNKLLSGINWLRWIYVERRVFEDRERIEKRLEKVISRLS